MKREIVAIFNQLRLRVIPEKKVIKKLKECGLNKKEIAELLKKAKQTDLAYHYSYRYLYSSEYLAEKVIEMTASRRKYKNHKQEGDKDGATTLK